MHSTPVAAGVGMLAGKEERLRHRLRELIRSVNRAPGNVGVSAQAVGVRLPVVHMPAQQVLFHVMQRTPQHD